MRWTGNVGRTFGQLLLALGIIAAVLGVVALAASAYLVGKAADNREAAQDIGDMLEGLVPAGLALLAGGVLGIVLAILVLGLARGLRDRQRTASGTVPSPAGPNVPE